MAKRNPAPKQTPEVDVLTIAYIAIGAKAALEAAGDSDVLANLGGELEYIAACTAHAAYVDTCGIGPDFEDFVGVHCYDIAEPFGHAYGTAILRGEHPAPKDIVAILRTAL